MCVIVPSCQIRYSHSFLSSDTHIYDQLNCFYVLFPNGDQLVPCVMLMNFHEEHDNSLFSRNCKFCFSPENGHLATETRDGLVCGNNNMKYFSNVASEVNFIVANIIHNPLTITFFSISI